MKKNGEFKCVYAGPDFFARKNGQKPDENDAREPENERKSYPDSFKDEQIEGKNRRNSMRILYAGPELRNKSKFRQGEPLMQAVYACPPMPPVSDEPQMMCVYAGPEMMSGKLRPENLPGQFVPKQEDTVMNELYAGPEMMEAALEVREQFAFCPNCGAKNNAAANFCSNCGEKLIKARFCLCCGNKLDDSANFCPNCGAKASSGGQEPPKKPILRKGFLARPKGSRDELV